MPRCDHNDDDNIVCFVIGVCGCLWCDVWRWMVGRRVVHVCERGVFMR